MFASNPWLGRQWFGDYIEKINFSAKSPKGETNFNQKED
jgi:hypothetical protein